MLKIAQYPRNADSTPMDLEVGVLTDSTGNGGARLVENPIGPDGAPIDAKGLVLVDATGNSIFIGDVAKVDSVAALKAAPVVGIAAKLVRYLNVAGAAGMWVARAAAPFAALIAADAGSAAYAQSTVDASVCWVRERENDELRPEWFNYAGLSTWDNPFALMLTLGRALSTGASSGVQQGPNIYLNFKFYDLADDFSCKGFVATWRGKGSGFVGWPNSGGSWIRMAPGKTFYFDRADTDGSTGYNAAAAVLFGCDGSSFYDICWIGPGKGVGAAPLLQLRANSVHFYNCRADSAGGIGLYIYATSGAHNLSEGNANGWRWIGGGITNCGDSGIKTLGADANAGIFTGHVFGNASYGIDEQSFLGNEYKVHCDGNTLGHIHGVGASNSTAFKGYFESGYPLCTIGARMRCEPIAGINPVGVTGAAFFATEGLIGVNGLKINRDNNAGTRTNIYIGSDLVGGVFSRASNTHWSSETYSHDTWFRQDADALVWGVNFGSIYAALNGNGTSGGRYAHGRATAPNAAYSLTTLWLGDGAFPDGRRILSLTAAPADISVQGDFTFTRSPTVGSPLLGWSCTTGGPTGGTQTTFYCLTATPAAIATSGSATDLIVGTVPAARMPAHTGDVTSTVGTIGLTIANGVVTYAKIQQVAASSLVGNPAGSLANAQGITLAGNLGFSGTTLRTQTSTNNVLVGRTTVGAGVTEEITLVNGLVFSGTTLGMGNITPTSVVTTGDIRSSGGKIGYNTGAGGTVAQATSKATGVTLNKSCGEITLNAAALAASTTISFVFTNSQIEAGDNIIMNHVSVGTFGSYTFNAHGFAAGSCTIDVRNVSLGSLSEAIVIRFTVLKGVIA